MSQESDSRLEGHWKVVGFPKPPSEDQVGILPRDCFELLQKKPPDLIEPALVLHDVRLVAGGLLTGETVSTHDGHFLSAAYRYFVAHACDHAVCTTVANQRRPKYLQANDPSKKGWALVVAEDVLGLGGVIRSRDTLCGDVRPHQLQRPIDFGRPVHRRHAARLLHEAADQVGLHVNASQEAFCNRVRGLPRVFTGAYWLVSANLNTPPIGTSNGRHGEYVAPNMRTMARSGTALASFLYNVTRHDAKML